MSQETQPAIASPAAKLGVTLLFALFYIAFLVETAALFHEFGGTGLALRLATLDGHNFLFFPIAGLLALVGFWRPTVLIADALARNRVRGGRTTLLVSVIVIGLVTAVTSVTFLSGPSRSLFEVAPAALVQDKDSPATGTQLVRQSLPDTLVSLKILAVSPDGLSSFRARCDREWLQFSPASLEEKYCVPAGRMTTVAECCEVKTAFREHVNALHAASPSVLATVHAIILPVKVMFLVTLFMVGVLLVRFRKSLQALQGERLADMSFGIAVGGVVMLMWPLLNAAYLETMSLLTGDGTSSAYAVFAPMIAFGFGIWALLLVFFHLRTYPSQVEFAARLAGFLAAAIGVLRYEEITKFFIANLGIGGGTLAILIFASVVVLLIVPVITGIDPSDFDFDRDTPQKS